MGATPSRRDFLSTSGTLLGSTWLLGLAPVLEATGRHARPARAESLPFDTFTEREGLDFEAFSAVIIPSGDTPGAREAGVVHFADRALGSFFSDLLPAVRTGLGDLRDRVRENHDGVDGFADLSDATQADLVRELERDDPAFFGLARTLVVLGVFSHPDHGGNRDQVGWQLLGYEPAPAYQPPFGHYDAVDGEG